MSANAVFQFYEFCSFVCLGMALSLLWLLGEKLRKSKVVSFFVDLAFSITFLSLNVLLSVVFLRGEFKLFCLIGELVGYVIFTNLFKGLLDRFFAFLYNKRKETKKHDSSISK